MIGFSCQAKQEGDAIKQKFKTRIPTRANAHELKPLSGIHVYHTTLQLCGVATLSNWPWRPALLPVVGPGSPTGWPAWCAQIYAQSSWMWQHLWHVHSPGRFNLAPEALRFIDIELALSRQGSENVLLQPDGLCSVPAVCWLLSARDTSAVQGTGLQISARDQALLKYNFLHKLWVKTMMKIERINTVIKKCKSFFPPPHFLVLQIKWIY